MSRHKPPGYGRPCVHKCVKILNTSPWLTSKDTRPFNAADFLSSYQQSFKCHPYEPPAKPLKPSDNRHPPHAAATTDMVSLYMHDYVAHSLHGNRYPPPRVKKKSEYRGPPASRIMKSSYQHDYPSKKLSPTKSFKPTLVYEEPNVKFGGRTLYKDSYPSYDPKTASVCRPAIVKPVGAIQINKSTNQKTTSTCHADYHAHGQVERPKPIIQPENQVKPEGPFQGVTMYQVTYHEKPVTQRTCTKEKHLFKKPEAKKPFECVTTSMADFKHHGVVKPVSCIRPPDATFDVPKAPFSTETTSRATYKAWPVTQKVTPDWAPTSEYKPTPSIVVMNTTYKMDYKRPPEGNLPRDPIVAPGSGDIIAHSRIPGCHGDGTTNYNVDYIAWEDARPATSFQKKRKYAPPTEAMMCDSTQRSHYKGKATEKATPCRHASEHRALYVNKNMSFRTTYQDTFTAEAAGLRPRSCPAPIARCPQCEDDRAQNETSSSKSETDHWN